MIHSLFEPAPCQRWHRGLAACLAELQWENYNGNTAAHDTRILKLADIWADLATAFSHVIPVLTVGQACRNIIKEKLPNLCSIIILSIAHLKHSAFYNLTRWHQSWPPWQEVTRILLGY